MWHSPWATCDSTFSTATVVADTDVTGTCSGVSSSNFAVGDTAIDSFTVTVVIVAVNTHSCAGILQPINANGGSVFKQGSTIPVKVTLRGASAGITNAVITLKVELIQSGGATLVVNESTFSNPASSGNQLRYDSAVVQYVYNLCTKNMQAGTYRLTVDFNDGNAPIIVEFGPRK